MTKRIAIPVVAVALALPLVVWAAQGSKASKGQSQAVQQDQQGAAVQQVALDGGTPHWNLPGTGGSGAGAKDGGTMGKVAELMDGGWKDVAKDAGVKLPMMRDGGFGGSGSNETDDLE